MPPRAATLPLLVVDGSWAEAWQLAEVTRADGSPLERQMAIMVLGNLARSTGDTELAWQMVRELLPRGPDSQPEDGLFPYAIETLRLASRLALNERSLSTARRWLDAHDRWLAWSGAERGRAESEMLRARLSQLEGNSEAARKRAEKAIELASDPRQPLLLLECHEILGRILLDMGSLEPARNELGQALTLATICSAPYLRARVMLHLSDAERASGRNSQADELLENACTIAQSLNARPLIAGIERRRAAPQSQPAFAGLTARESEVLRLVAQGMTDAEIAERLSISPRTVGQHLRSVYNKLDVSSRAAATRLAVEQHLV